MHEKIKEPIKAVKTAESDYIKAKGKLHKANKPPPTHLLFEVQRRLSIAHHLKGRHKKAVRQFAMAIGLANALQIEEAVVAELYFFIGDAFFWLECYDEMIAISSVGLSKLKKKSPPETMLL